MSAAARYELAERLAADIIAKAEELSTAIYEASKYGYVAKVRLCNGHFVAGVFVGDVKPSLVVKATISFDIGDSAI